MASPDACYHMTPPGRAVVDQVGRARKPLRHLVYHSPDGYAWGYGGSGPADLALALLAHHLREIRAGSPSWYGTRDHWRSRIEATRAWALHQDFTWQVVARQPKDEPWTISGAEIAAWIAAQCAEKVGTP